MFSPYTKCGCNEIFFGFHSNMWTYLKEVKEMAKRCSTNGCKNAVAYGGYCKDCARKHGPTSPKKDVKKNGRSVRQRKADQAQD